MPAPTDPLISAPPRPDFATLPPQVRAVVADRLGAPVVRAVSARGGFSPGVAARLVTATGARAFLKAVPAASATADLHRREAEVTAALPRDLPVPALLDSFESAGHVVLLFADVDGAMPRHPWSARDLAAVHATLDVLVERLTPCPVAAARPVAGELGGDLAAWSRIAADPAARDRLGSWSRRNMARLVAACGPSAADRFAGDTLVHLDTRADNVLLTDASSTGSVVVDWPWAALGAPWLDRVALAVDVGVGGGDPAAALTASAVGRAADPDGVTTLLAALAGMWTEVVDRPPASGMPTIRGFQRAELDVTLRWLRTRTGWA